MVKIFGRGNKEEKKEDKTEVKSLLYITTDGVTFGERNLVEEEVRKRYGTGKDVNRLIIMGEVKKERNVPKEVGYLGKSLTVEALSIDKAKETIRNSKDVLEENYGVKISDCVKLKKF